MVRGTGWALAAACMAWAAAGQDAHAGGLRIQDGQWRFEVQGGPVALEDGSFDFNDGFAVIGEVEYEIPMGRHFALGARLIPLFVVAQDDVPRENPFAQFGDHDGATVWGGGAGLSFRAYQHADARTGFYFELGIAALGHGSGLEGNDSNLNFLSEIGVGYQFAGNPWHVALSLQHLSNAGLGDENEGLNLLALAAGARF